MPLERLLRFLVGGAERFVELGLMTAAGARELVTAVRAAEARPETRMLTPPVLEMIARVP